MSSIKTCSDCNGLGLNIQNGVATGCKKCEAMGYLIDGKSIFEDNSNTVCDLCGKSQQKTQEIRGKHYVLTLCKDCKEEEDK